MCKGFSLIVRQAGYNKPFCSIIFSGVLSKKYKIQKKNMVSCHGTFHKQFYWELRQCLWCPYRHSYCNSINNCTNGRKWIWHADKLIISFTDYHSYLFSLLSCVKLLKHLHVLVTFYLNCTPLLQIRKSISCQKQ
jgi:hypothetical protein